MEVRKCLEYYFEKDTTKEEIMKYLERNIDELKKISKIKDIKIEIEQNEYEVQKATMILIIKRREIRKQKVKIRKTNQTIKIESDKSIKKYGTYKEGGRFVPYQEKKKGKIEIWKNKLKRLNKNQ
ncbi:MAG: hypothetical protein HFJ48_06505 [Clostridia bacterium]|nr:hypothetical protein [Clostridia bacterium]